MRLEVVGPKNNERQCEVKVPLIKHLVNPFVINMTTVRVPPALPRHTLSCHYTTRKQFRLLTLSFKSFHMFLIWITLKYFSRPPETELTMTRLKT